MRGPSTAMFPLKCAAQLDSTIQAHFWYSIGKRLWIGTGTFFASPPSRFLAGWADTKLWSENMSVENKTKKSTSNLKGVELTQPDPLMLWKRSSWNVWSCLRETLPQQFSRGARSHCNFVSFRLALLCPLVPLKWESDKKESITSQGAFSKWLWFSLYKWEAEKAILAAKVNPRCNIKDGYTQQSGGWCTNPRYLS